VILPDHLHAIFTLPSGDSDFSGRWRRIKGHFSSALIDASTQLKRRPNGNLALWPRRFWEHTIRDEGDFARHVDYIHFNSVKHALVSRVRDWPHSSFHRYATGRSAEDPSRGCHVANHPRCIYKQRIVARTGEICMISMYSQIAPSRPMPVLDFRSLS